MSSAPVRIAVVGGGLIGRVHLAALQGSSKATPVALVDPHPEACRLAAVHRIAHFSALGTMLETVRPEGVIIATPNALHVPQALLCMAQAVPTLLEKPVAPSLAEAEPLLAAADGAVPLLIGHHRAHSPIMQRARLLIAQGRIGRVVAITGSAAFYKPDDYFETAPWRREPGGGPVLINLIHDVHAYRSLCGEVAAVQAMASSAMRGHAVEDTVSINFRFTNGALGNFLLSDTAATPHSWEQTSGENPAYARDDNADCYLVSGTRGSLSIPSLDLRSNLPDESPSWHREQTSERQAIERLDPIGEQLAHFVAVIRGEQVPLVTLADGLANLAVTEAVLTAARTGSTVALSGAESGTMKAGVTRAHPGQPRA